MNLVEQASKTKAILALVFGILSIVLGFVPVVGFIFVVLGIIFGIIGMKQSKGMSITGLILSILSGIGQIIFTIFFAAMLTSPEFQEELNKELEYQLEESADQTLENIELELEEGTSEIDSIIVEDENTGE